VIICIDNQIEPTRSYASERTRGLYNVGVQDGCRFVMDVDVPIEKDDWQVGVIVGPSGSGKTSIARELFRQGWNDWDPENDWGNDPIIDVLSKGDDAYAKATAALSAVGLGSVPAWLRPYRILSNGEQFRANLAMLIRFSDQYGDKGIVIDEFTSVLDRQVAKVGANAFAKAWRKRTDKRIILITPHYDILDWVEPDWWIDTAEGADEFASDRGVVQAREGSFQETRHHGGYSGDRVATLEC
jgi:ABC-type ATPase with predicted acetyltransferase domain